MKVWDSAFTKYAKLAKFENIKTEEFLIRLPFYCQTTEDAHIVLTDGLDSNIVYEIGNIDFKKI